MKKILLKLLSSALVLSISNMGWAFQTPVERKNLTSQELQQKTDTLYDRVVHDGFEFKTFDGKEISKADLLSGKVSDIVMASNERGMENYVIRAQRGSITQDTAEVVMTVYTKDRSERLGSQPIVIDAKKTDEQNYVAMQASVQQLTRVMKPEQASLWKKIMNQMFPVAHAETELQTIFGGIGLLTFFALMAASEIENSKYKVIAYISIGVLAAGSALAFYAIDRFAPKR